MNHISSFVYLRPGLVQAMHASDPVRPPRVLRIFNGKQEAKPERKPGEDQLVLEIRRLSEQEGRNLKTIYEAVQKFGSVRSKSWVNQVINYYCRAHLVPTENATPYLKATS